MGVLTYFFISCRPGLGFLIAAIQRPFSVVSGYASNPECNCPWLWRETIIKKTGGHAGCQLCPFRLEWMSPCFVESSLHVSGNSKGMFYIRGWLAVGKVQNKTEKKMEDQILLFTAANNLNTRPWSTIADLWYTNSREVWSNPEIVSLISGIILFILYLF